MIPEHELIETLFKLGLSTPKSLVQFSKFIRDSQNIGALQCQNSGVIVLDKIDHITTDSHKRKSGFSYWGVGNRTQVLKDLLSDDQRRANLIRPLVTGKTWLDFGTGVGGILDLLGDAPRHSIAVEPQPSPRNTLIDLGYDVRESIDECDDVQPDLISLFHVFEHLINPIGLLKKLKSILPQNGQIIIETPNANDALISKYNCTEFIEFTLWSDHLLLHSAKSLKCFIEAAGFEVISLTGVQRYSLANHVYWLSKQKPGGHKIWREFGSIQLNAAYEEFLVNNGMTDTLIALAKMK